MLKNFFFLITLLSFSFCLSANKIDDIPERLSEGSLNDYVNEVKLEYKEKIDKLGLELKQKTNTELVVMLIRYTGAYGADIDSYMEDLFKKWSIGQKNNDRAVLFIFIPTITKMKIKVSPSLEKILPNDFNEGILERYVFPFFSIGEYGFGFLQGSVGVANVLAAEKGVTLNTALENPLKDDFFYIYRKFFYTIGFFFVLILIIPKPIFSFIFWTYIAGIGYNPGSKYYRGRFGSFNRGISGSFGKLGGASGDGGASRGW